MGPQRADAPDTRIERRQVLKGFLIAGPTLAVAARLGSANDAGAFPTRTDEVTGRPGLHRLPHPERDTDRSTTC